MIPLLISSYLFVGTLGVGFVTGMRDQTGVTTYRKFGLFSLFTVLWPLCAVYLLGRLASRRAVQRLEERYEPDEVED